MIVSWKPSFARICYLNKTLYWLRNYFNVHSINWHRKMSRLVVSGTSVTKDSWKSQLLNEPTQRSWILQALGTILVFASLILSLLSAAPLIWTPRVFMRHGVFQRENGRVVGMWNHQGTSAPLDPPLASGLFSRSVCVYQVLAFTCSCMTHVLGVRMPRSRNLVSSE